MADWIVGARTDPPTFPVVQHRHPNGLLAAVRDGTPEVVRDRAPQIERWAYACACGEVYIWERVGS